MSEQDPLAVLNAKQGPKPDEWRWSTYVKDRRPQTKIHRYIGHAKSALKNKEFHKYDRSGFETWTKVRWWELGCRVFELRNDEWVEVTGAWKEEAKVKS